MTKKLLLLPLLCLASLAMAQKIRLIREYTVSKDSVSFGDTYIESSKSDTFYINAPVTNNALVSVQVVFDEDRAFNCPQPNGITGAIPKNIFEVFVDTVQLTSAYELFSFPIPESAKGNTTVSIAPGDSVMIVVNATPSYHLGRYVPEEGDVLYDCDFIQDSKNSLGSQSDEIIVRNASTNIGSNTISLSFNGVENETDINGLFQSNEDDTYLNVYPNPATSFIYTEEGIFEVFDLMGHSVLYTKSTGTVDVSDLKRGVYMAKQNDKKIKLIIE